MAKSGPTSVNKFCELAFAAGAKLRSETPRPSTCPIQRTGMFMILT